MQTIVKRTKEEDFLMEKVTEPNSDTETCRPTYRRQAVLQRGAKQLALSNHTSLRFNQCFCQNFYFICVNNSKIFCFNNFLLLFTCYIFVVIATPNHHQNRFSLVTSCGQCRLKWHMTSRKAHQERKLSKTHLERLRKPNKCP